MQGKGNRGLFITEISEEHGRLDFYLSERGPSLIIAKKIQEQYGGSIKQSSKNIGMKDSRQLYRMTYLVRLPSYEKGDFLKHDDSFFLIVSIHANRVKMINLSNWEESVVDVKTIQKAKTIEGKELIKEMILVSQTKDEVQLMNQKNYEINVVKKPKPISFDSKTLKVINLDNKYYLIPK